MKKKILLYTGNHFDSGIVDYVKSLKILCNKKNYIFFKSDSLALVFKKKFDAIVFIENFTSLKDLIFLKVVTQLKTVKILILTEFVNDSIKTFNNFENLNFQQENNVIKTKTKFNYLVLKYFKFFFTLIFFILKRKKKIRYILSKIYNFFKSFLFFLISVCVVFFLRRRFKSILRFYRIVSYCYLKKSIKKKIKVKNKLRLRAKKLNIQYNDYQDYLFMKERYENFLIIKNNFDYILSSHDGIKMKNLNLKKFYFYISGNNKIYVNKEKKLKLTFSGFLNGFRIAELEKLLKNKNDFFDYSLIEEVLKFKTPRFIVQNKDTNICSLHIKKSKNWLYSSPTRYINSLEKKEIPIILDNFNDDITNKLFLYKDFLNCKNFEEVDKYLNNLNQNIREYARKQEGFFNNFDELLQRVS